MTNSVVEEPSGVVTVQSLAAGRFTLKLRLLGLTCSGVFGTIVYITRTSIIMEQAEAVCLRAYKLKDQQVLLESIVSVRGVNINRAELRPLPIYLLKPVNTPFVPYPLITYFGSF